MKGDEDQFKENNELVPLVDAKGKVIGCITRDEAHNGSHKLHPVVHLHVYNSKGELFLQKRPAWKIIQPNKWDTACGGHMDYGETLEESLQREVREELGIVEFIPKLVKQYVYESNVEREFVNVFTTTYDGPIHTNKTELDGGRYWKYEEIKMNLGKHVFTENFEHEFLTILDH